MSITTLPNGAPASRKNGEASIADMFRECHAAFNLSKRWRQFA
jgi:hypothetical protein